MLDAIAASEAATPPMRMFASVDKADMRRQAAEATARLPPLLLPSPACRLYMMTSWGFCATEWTWQSDCYCITLSSMVINPSLLYQQGLVLFVAYTPA